MPPPILAAPQPIFLDRYRDVIRNKGANAAMAPATMLDTDSILGDELYYVPFEHMNVEAKLVIVGITPGPRQIALAYEAARVALNAGLNDLQVSCSAKKEGAFGGPTMRPNLIRMLRAFNFSELIDIEDPTALWGRSSSLLHAISIVPHAAFRKGTPFSGKFDDVLASPILRNCFERDFASTLPLISPNAFYVALGPAPLAALDWCSDQNLIRADQVLGAFAHPSRSGGTQVDIYLGERSIDDLTPRDPVLRRVDWLTQAATRMRQSVCTQLERKGAAKTMINIATATGVGPTTVGHTPLPGTDAPKASPTPTSFNTGALGLHAIKKRGANIGVVLRPHVQDGAYVVSTSRYARDYVRVPLHEPLEPWLLRGYSLRMSAPGHSPSLIAPASIRGRNRVG